MVFIWFNSKVIYFDVRFLERGGFINKMVKSLNSTPYHPYLNEYAQPKTFN